MTEGGVMGADGRDWQDIRTIPVDCIVTVRTVKHIVCRARTYPVGGGSRWVKRPTARAPYYSVDCYRVDDTGRLVGDVRAVAWRP